MANLILHLGSNMGRREAHLAAAREAVSGQIGPILSTSPIFETAAWGQPDQASFLNQALWVETSLPPQDALEAVLRIERAMGRVRQYKWGPRLIDIDLIFYDDLILESPTLIIPHPWMQNRRFVLAPLAELIPAWVHPVFQKTVAELLAECGDEGEVRKIQDLE